ncbi:hypothetical protein THAOC_21218, partial [Thalassiosira oceanica]
EHVAKIQAPTATAAAQMPTPLSTIFPYLTTYGYGHAVLLFARASLTFGTVQNPTLMVTEPTREMAEGLTPIKWLYGSLSTCQPFIFLGGLAMIEKAMARHSG